MLTRSLFSGIKQGSVLTLPLYLLSLEVNAHMLVHTTAMLILGSSTADPCFKPIISACLVDISTWMVAHHLKLTPSKTGLVHILEQESPWIFFLSSHCLSHVVLYASSLKPREDKIFLLQVILQYFVIFSMARTTALLPEAGLEHRIPSADTKWSFINS